MIKYFSAFILIICLFFGIHCKDEPTKPSDEVIKKPGEYTWTIDTLKDNPGDLFYMFSLWGSSPTNVWVTGSGASRGYIMWHYDGKTWKTDPTQILSSNMFSIFGFAQNDVWACDAPGHGAYHYDGQQWLHVYKYSNPYTYLLANNIWGDAPNNIFIAGRIDTIANGNYKGVILRYDGNTWNFLPIPNYRVDFTCIRRGVLESNKYYLSAVRFESTTVDTNKIFELDGSNLKEIYSGTEGVSVNEMAGRIYHCIGKKIYKYQNDQFIVWKDFSATKHLGRVWGRSEVDFFTVASDGLAHYNGTDLVTLYPTNLFINDAFVFEKDIFILCNNRIIIRGTLK